MANSSFAKLRKLQGEAQAYLQERTLPIPDESGMTRARRFLLFCARVYHSFGRNRCPVRAAALAYTNLLALVPLLAVAVSVSATFLKSQGEQSIQDWIREGITQIAPTLGLKNAGEISSGLFTPEDISDRDLDALISKLESGKDPLSRYLWDDRFTTTNKLVLSNSSLPKEERKATLTAELNRVVSNDALYETRRFAPVHLSARTSKLASQMPQGQELVRLNHSLLSEAYSLGQDPLDTVLSHITGFIANFQSGKLGVTAVMALIFLAISLLATVETTFNDMWGVARGRGWFARVVQYWAALTLGPMFLLSALTLTTWVNVEHVPLVGFAARFLAPLMILSFGCALLYLVMPNTRVQWQAALLGGFVAGALLQLNSYCNVMYVSKVVTYKQIYGSMAALPLFLLGLYFSWLLVLLGAQVTYAYQNRQAYVQEKRAETVHQRGREFLAVRLMTYIGQRFHCGQRPATSLEMAEDLKVPLQLVGQIVSRLIEGGLLLEVAGAENACAPARPLNHMTIQDVLEALRVGQGQELTTRDDAARVVVQKEFETIELAWKSAARSLCVEDLVSRSLAQPAPDATNG